MFEINKKSNIIIEEFKGSKIYTIDDFYVNPLSICKYFLQIKPELRQSGPTKSDEKTFNGIYFEDRGHRVSDESVIKVFEYIGSICNQKPVPSTRGVVMTNVARFKDCKFNDYENNYWWPHYDAGYTALVYFNYDDTEAGTNLYYPLDDYPSNIPNEHINPWISKKRFKLLKTIKPKFNRMILFEANKFLHGMHIANKKYFSDEYRLNQVLFFQKN